MKSYLVRCKPNKFGIFRRSGRVFTNAGIVITEEELTDAIRNEPMLEIEEILEPEPEPEQVVEPEAPMPVEEPVEVEKPEPAPVEEPVVPVVEIQHVEEEQPRPRRGRRKETEAE